MDEYRVFISHKKFDEASARAIRDALAQFSGDLQFFISGDSIRAGENWQTRLRSELKNSDLLLLLFTEPTLEWDWCLYEVGLFTDLDSEVGDPVVCIYPPDGEPPSPIGSIQGVPGGLDSVANFVRSFVKTTDITKRDRPLNANITEEQITAAATAICSHFEATIQPYYTCHRVFLELPVDHVEATSIPPNARIKASEATMALFGRLEGTPTWGELVESHIQSNAQWLDELNKVFSDACAGRVSSITTHTFRAYDRAHIFRPELYRIDKAGRRPTSAVVVFTQVVAPARVGGPLFNRLRIAERYKSEVFERLQTFDQDLSGADMRALHDAVVLIREEAKMFDVFDEETLGISFSDDEAREELLRIGREWGKTASTLDSKLGDDDSAGFRWHLLALEALNNRYRAIVAGRYAEVLNRQDD